MDRDYYDLHKNADPDLDPAGNYSTVTYGAYAESVIDAHDTSDPLFLYVASNTIHTPWEVPDDYKTQYRGYGLGNSRKKASGNLDASQLVTDLAQRFKN